MLLPNNMPYRIKPLKSERDSLFKTPAQKAYIMPPPGTMVVCGATGSGKTTIIGNLLKERSMLKGYFDKIYLFCLSPATTLVDNVEELNDDNVFLEDNPEVLAEIYDKQKKNIKSLGFKRCPHILFILDDMIQSKNFLGSKHISNIFFGGTHSKVSLWILSQNYMSVPRRWRMNAHSMILCHGVNNTEIDRFATEWQSCYMTKDEFIELVKHAINEPYSFMFVNGTIPDKRKMFRKGFDTILKIN